MIFKELGKVTEVTEKQMITSNTTKCTSNKISHAKPIRDIDINCDPYSMVKYEISFNKLSGGH